MNIYKITFRDEVSADTEEQCYEELLRYLRDCVENGDVTAFNFEVTKRLLPIENKNK